MPRYFERFSWDSVESHTPLTPFRLVGLEQDTITNQEIAGKVAWIELYTTTCRPCVQEMASTEKVAQAFSGNSQVQFLTVSSAYFEDHDRFANAEQFHKFKLWHGYEEDTLLAATYAQDGVPVGLLVDKKGNVRFEKHGFGDKDAPYFEKELTAKINALLNEG